MEKLNYFLSAVLSAVCAIFGIVDVSAVMTADSAAAAIAGASTVNADGNSSAVVGHEGVGVHLKNGSNGLNTDDIRLGSPDLIDDPIDRAIVKMFQSAVAVDQICRHLKQVKQNGMRYSFYSVDTRPIKDTLAEDFATANGRGKLIVTNSNIFDKTDEIVIPSVTECNGLIGSAALVPLHLYVESVGVDDNGKHFLMVSPINCENNVIPDIEIPTGGEVVIYRLGHAASEGDVQTTPFSALPEPDEFFMQIFKTQVMETSISAESDKKVDWTINDQQELALYNLRKEIELCYIYGCKGYFRDQVTKRYVYTCAGIIQQILEKGNVIHYVDTTDGVDTPLTDKALMEVIAKPIFLGNSGSATRYMFAGTDLVTKIATIPSVTRQMGATEVKREFGIDWSTIRLMSWSLQLYHHPLLDEIGLSRCAFVLDLPYVRKNVFRSLKEDVLELVKAGVYDGKSSVWTEISSIALKYPKCHAYIVADDVVTP